MSNSLNVFLVDAHQTVAFGAAIAKACREQTIIFLHGDLGAGKTTLTRGYSSIGS